MSMLPRLSVLILSLAIAAQAPAQGFGFGFGFGAVFTQTNDPSDNHVAVAVRLPSGNLLPFADFSTGGTGSGSSLGSQGSLAASRNGRTLLAVNAGSNELTVFHAFFGVLLFRTDTVSSRGTMPISVALHDDLVYALNAGSDSIAGFHLHHGHLVQIPGAVYALSQSGAQPAKVGFDPDGSFLVVTEKATNRIDVFPVHHDGTLGTAQFQASAGQTPFGFLFRQDGTLVVSEAAANAPGASTTSTYRIRPDGSLLTVTAAAPTHQTAACWVAIPTDGRFAYTSNTGSGTVTGFSVNHSGALSLLDPTGVSANLGAAARPIDNDFEPSGRFLFVLDSAANRIESFLRLPNGSLVHLPHGLSVASGSAGLVAR